MAQAEEQIINESEASRNRQMTEKGKAYNISMLKASFTRECRAWQREYTKAKMTCLSSVDLEILKEQIPSLESQTESLFASHEKLIEVLQMENEFKEVERLDKEFLDLQKLGQAIEEQLFKKIESLQLEICDKQSVSEHSAISSKYTTRTKTSYRSGKSSNSESSKYIKKMASDLLDLKTKLEGLTTNFTVQQPLTNERISRTQDVNATLNPGAKSFIPQVPAVKENLPPVVSPIYF